RGLGGPMPSTMDRYELGKLGGEMSLDLRVAALVTPEQAQDPFASKVARNRGVRLEVFTDREKALAWLLREPGGS
ncbi:MAG TPA: hypothetical protein VEN81_15050, partial [Planctomycetota bacterium]|nr:hypothetical protein [Planctomycetota bacterium]